MVVTLFSVRSKKCTEDLFKVQTKNGWKWVQMVRNLKKNACTCTYFVSSA